jgi:hypothetical protein
MKRIFGLLLIVFFTSIWLGGCNLPANNTGTEAYGQAQTLAALTVDARITQNAARGSTEPLAPTNTPALFPTNTSGPSITPSPSNTPYSAPTATGDAPCNQAQFIDDVTIPDGTEMDPGETFTKTWQVRNIGSCTWNENYTLVFDTGNALGAAAVIDFPTGSVSPNETVNLSIEFTAPTAPGDYRSDWMLRSDTDQVFGTGSSGMAPIYTEITVVSPLSYTITIINSHDCSGDLVIALAVENNGTEFLQSATGVITNLDTSVSVYLPPMNSPFVENPNSCAAGNVSDADPGETYYFMVNVGAATSGDQFQITTSFCTEDGLGGDCLDKTKNYTVP